MKTEQQTKKELTREELAALPREGWFHGQQGQFVDDDQHYRLGEADHISREIADEVIAYALTIVDAGAMQSMTMRTTPYATYVKLFFGFGHIYFDYHTPEQAAVCERYHASKAVVEPARGMAVDED